MKIRIRRQLATMRRVKQFGVDHPLALPVTAAVEEFAALTIAILRLESMAENQLAGNATVTGAVRARLAVERRLLKFMSNLAKVAKTLDTADHPDVAKKMRMRGIDSFEELMTRARLFHSTLEPIVDEFIAMGSSPTVLDDLHALIVELRSAGNLKLKGRDVQIGGTIGLDEAARSGMKGVQKLDAILTQVYQTDAVMLEQWTSAKRQERSRAAASEPEVQTINASESGVVAAPVGAPQQAVQPSASASADRSASSPAVSREFAVDLLAERTVTPIDNC